MNVSFLSAGAGSCLSPRLTVTHCMVSLHRLTQMNTTHTQIRLAEHILSPVRHLVIFRISPVTHSESSLLLKRKRKRKKGKEPEHKLKKDLKPWSEERIIGHRALLTRQGLQGHTSYLPQAGGREREEA